MEMVHFPCRINLVKHFFVMSEETTVKENPNPAQQQMSWLQWVFTPGIGSGVIKFCRVSLLACFFFLVYMTLFHYNIHYFIMSMICCGLFCSFEFFISELRKNPEIMNPSETPKEEETKPKTD